MLDTLSIIAQIKAGENEQKYEKWAKDKNVHIRYNISQKGYFPELLIYDDDDLIRTETVKAHPNYIHYLLNKPEYLDDVNYILSQRVKPQLDILKLHIQNMQEYKPEWRPSALELKLKSLTYKPTLLEKNMTPLQLYRTNSPLWALTLTAEDIMDVWEAEYETQTSEEKFQEIMKYRTISQQILQDGPMEWLN